MKGILFKPDMIQAAVEGRKTNTRRAEAGLKEINQEPDAWELLPGHESDSLVFLFRHKELSEVVSTKPRYHAGETVYIKEAWTYALDYNMPDLQPNKQSILYKLDSDILAQGNKWQSPLFMPERAARHFIPITGVRAERLQEITEEDAKAEGVEPILFEPDEFTNRALRRVGAEEVTRPYPVGWKNYLYIADKRYKYSFKPRHPAIDDCPEIIDTARGSFFSLWNSINPKYPWKSNPWVFAYTFERLEKGNENRSL